MQVLPMFLLLFFMPNASNIPFGAFESNTSITPFEVFGRLFI